MQLSGLNLPLTRSNTSEAGIPPPPPTDYATSPAIYFQNGYQGVWYAPNELNTLFQNTAGTIPVTGVEQPVGKMLDKSGGGNHVYQSDNARRPILSARVNLLTGTETLATQTITIPDNNVGYILHYVGTGTITLLGVITGVYTSGATFGPTVAGALTFIVSGSVTKADFRSLNDYYSYLPSPAPALLPIPAYQRVTTSTNYDTVGFPKYLKYDANNATQMYTANIPFGGDTLSSSLPMLIIMGANFLPGGIYQDATCGPWHTGATTTFLFACGDTMGSAVNVDNSVAGVNSSTPTKPYKAAVRTQYELKPSPDASTVLIDENNAPFNYTYAASATNFFPSQPIYLGSDAGYDPSMRMYSYVMSFKRPISSQDAQETIRWVMNRTFGPIYPEH